jgi:hypothetical protein
MSKRVVFTFDEKSLTALKEIAKGGSMAGAVRDSIRIMRALQSQAAQGFTELIVRNPKTGKERVMIWK